MQINIENRTIKSNNYIIGTQGENHVETITFIIPKLFNNIDLSVEGTQCMLYGVTSKNTEIIKTLTPILFGDTLEIPWKIGTEETADTGMLLVALHFTTAFDSIMKTKPCTFMIENTINVQSPHPTVFNSRVASPLSVEPDIDVITVSNNKMIIPTNIQALAVQNDNESRKIIIAIPKFFQGEDLSKYGFKLHALTSDGSVWVVLNPIDVDGELRSEWVVERPLTSFSGKVSLQLEIGDEATETFFKQTEIASVNILPSLDSEPIVPVAPSEFLQYLSQMEALSTETKAAVVVVTENIEVITQAATLSPQAIEAATTATLQANRAKSEADKAAAIVGNLGWFETSQKLTTAHPLGFNGAFAVVGETDTIWVWDIDTTAWKDSRGQGSGDYAQLANKPFINGIGLNAGDNTLAALGIASVVEVEAKADKSPLLMAALPVENWVGSAAPYTQTAVTTGIKATDTPIIEPVLSDETATAITELEAWSMVSKAVTTANSITFTCFEDKPVVDIVVQIKVVY